MHLHLSTTIQYCTTYVASQWLELVFGPSQGWKTLTQYILIRAVNSTQCNNNNCRNVINLSHVFLDAIASPKTNYYISHLYQSYFSSLLIIFLICTNHISHLYRWYSHLPKRETAMLSSSAPCLKRNFFPPEIPALTKINSTHKQQMNSTPFHRNETKKIVCLLMS